MRQDDPKTPKKQAKARTQWQAVAFVGGIGIQFVVMVGICIFLGKKADEYLGTAPYGTITGIVAGFPLTLYSVYKKIKEIL